MKVGHHHEAADIRTPAPSDLQRRILEDFADDNPRTRHSRTRLHESLPELPKMIKLGWLAHGDPKQAKWYYITPVGLAALGKVVRVCPMCSGTGRVEENAQADPVPSGPFRHDGGGERSGSGPLKA